MTNSKIGRPTKPAADGTRASLGLRVTATLKNRLDEAAKASGRSQSQEAEHRLELSFRDDRLEALIKSATDRILKSMSK